MARSANYYGLRSGSTKSHTYSVMDGKQITKDRVEGGKNPRTLAQMTQRCIITTNGIAYGAMKSICDHSFEGITAGMQCMREFCSTNLKKIRISKEYGDGSFGFAKYQHPGLVPGSYVISKGSLPDALVDAVVDSVDVSNKKVTLTLVTSATGTVAEVADAMGCKNFNDICTIAMMYPKADGNYGFSAVRFTYKSGATVLDSFAVAVSDDAVSAIPSFTSNTLKVEVRMRHALAAGATAADIYIAAIASRKVNGNWLRSNAQFHVSNATPTFAQAISTYPVGRERFLNGGEIVSSESAGSPSAGNNTAGGGGFNGNPTDDTQGGSGNDPSTGSGQGNENQGGNENQNSGSGSSGSSGSSTTSVATPVISDDANITANGTVHVTCATDGATMYYTVGMDSDPADPTNQSTAVPANGTIVANESYSEDAHLKVIAYKDGVYSSVASKTVPARQDD